MCMSAGGVCAPTWLRFTTLAGSGGARQVLGMQVSTFAILVTACAVVVLGVPLAIFLVCKRRRSTQSVAASGWASP
jgi:hypothetical protein